MSWGKAADVMGVGQKMGYLFFFPPSPLDNTIKQQISKPIIYDLPNSNAPIDFSMAPSSEHILVPNNTIKYIYYIANFLANYLFGLSGWMKV